MCGRYVFNPGKPDEFFDRYSIDNKDIDLQDNYNVAPGQLMPTIVQNSPNKAVLMKWGLIPFWAKDPSIGYKMINARAETVAEKPSYKKALVSQRCLVPSSGFYEWKHVEKEKIPVFIHKKDYELFSFAGIYDIWKDAEGKETYSYSIITTEPNSFMKDIHDRMPVILTKDVEDMWLSKSNNDPKILNRILKPYKGKDLVSHFVSTRVNSPVNNSPDLLKPVD